MCLHKIKKCAQTKVQKMFTKMQKNLCTHRSLKSGYKTLKSGYKKLKSAYKNLKSYCKFFYHFFPQWHAIKECQNQQLRR